MQTQPKQEDQTNHRNDVETETIHFPQERTDNPFTPRGRGIRNPFISFQEDRHPSQGRDHHKVPLRVPGLLPVRSSSTSREVKLGHLFSDPGPHRAQLGSPADDPHCGQTVH